MLKPDDRRFPPQFLSGGIQRFKDCSGNVEIIVGPCSSGKTFEIMNNIFRNEKDTILVMSNGALKDLRIISWELDKDESKRVITWSEYILNFQLYRNKKVIIEDLSDVINFRAIAFTCREGCERSSCTAYGKQKKKA
jgi:hypothetical protein